MRQYGPPPSPLFLFLFALVGELPTPVGELITPVNKLITGGISLKKPFSKLKKPIIKLVAGVNGLRTAVKKRPRPLQKDRDASKQNLAEKMDAS